MERSYTPPEVDATAFTCPHCGVYSRQISYKVNKYKQNEGSTGEGRLRLSICEYCRERTIWYDSQLIYPDSSTAPMPHPDMPDDVKFEYMEARSIVSTSPKGAAALLRLGVQKLCAHLGESGKNINGDIASLVQRGLAPTVQKALDVVRVVGNDAVHPGQINLNDTPEIAGSLFKLLNYIVEDRITRPKEIDELYGSLPEDKRKWIEDRDKKPKTEVG